MITNIKVEKIVVAKGVLYEKTFAPIDITSQCESPIYDFEQLDNVLDTTQITLLNKDSKPLKPFTRIIITITDTVDSVEQKHYIYRFVEKDRVTNLTYGANKLYKHQLSLIEITKLLERAAVDNITFTNYLGDNYGTDNTIKFSSDNWLMTGFAAWNNWFVKATFQSFNYNSPNRFIGPYRLLYKSGYKKVEQSEDGSLLVVANDAEDFNPITQIKIQDALPALDDLIIGDYVKYWDRTVENTINANVSLDIVVKYATTNTTSWFGWWQYRSLILREYSVRKPNGQNQTLTLGSNFTFTETGTYTFRQFYSHKDPDNGNVLATSEITWSITVVNDIKLLPQDYNLHDVVQRLLSVCKLRRLNIDAPKFIIDESIVPILQSKLSPEFNFTQGTLFEALQQIGDFIHAIPRLIPTVEYDVEYDEDGNIVSMDRNDYTNWNKITFDFLGSMEEVEIKNISIQDAEYGMDDFATNFVSNVQNATQSNYSGNSTIVEPFIGGYLSTRTESTNFEISNDAAIFKTTQPIRSLIAVKVWSKTKAKNITDNIVEKAKFDILKSYTDLGDIYNNKAFFLYFTKGTKNIYNLSYLRPNQDFMGAIMNRQTIKNILGLDDSVSVENYIKDLAVQIEYIPFQNFKVRQFKMLADPTSEDVSLFYNQQSNEVDIESYGESIKGALLKTGNAKESPTAYTNNYSTIPKIGKVANKSNIFAIKKELIPNTPIKITFDLSKNYNELNAYTALKKTVRQYEISETESVNRNVDYPEFCVVDTILDVGYIFDDPSLIELQDHIKTLLSIVGFGTNKNLTQIANKISNQDIDYKPLSYAIIKTTGISRDGSQENYNFLLPVSCFAFGNAIVIRFETDNNYSAGTFAENPTGKDQGAVDSYRLEEFIRYSNEFGRFDNMFIAFGSDNPLLSYSNNITNNSKMLYKISESDINNDSIIVDFRDNPFIVDKDNREQISLTTQLNFITTNENIVIGKALTHTMPMIGDITTKYKYVLFNQKPNKFEEVASNFTICGNITTSISNDTKAIKINGVTCCIDAVGYGIIDNNNKLVVYVDKPFLENQTTDPIYLMFRSKI